MKRQISKIAAITLAMTLLLAIAVTPAGATRYGDISGVPAGYWAVFTPYEDALNAKDANGILTHGEKNLEFWFQGRTAEECAAEWVKDVANHGWEINAIWSSVWDEMAPRYEARGDNENTLRMYRIALAFVDPYIALMKTEPKMANQNPDDMEYARTKILAKLGEHDVEAVPVSLYAEIAASQGTGDTSYTGSINEPRAGTYYGETSGQYAIMDLPQKPSSTIIYVEYEFESMEARVTHDLDENEARGYDRNGYSVVEIAWNFHGEGATPKTVPNDRTKITEAANYLKELGLPVLLRVGAEMNVWPGGCNSGEFIAAFRFIADIMHSIAPNVAMVWSVNYISSEGIDYRDYYPGKAYVDWVGISLYTNRYFLGNPNTTDGEAMVYATGQYADPIGHIQTLVELYGDDHPIMIAEGAVSIRINSNGEDVTQWAVPRIRQTYAYIPMLFPQVKAIIWFNKNDIRNDYSFSGNTTVKNLYQELTTSGYFMGKGVTSPSITYKELGTQSFPSNAVTLLTYAPYFTRNDVFVQYQVDGKWAGQSSSIPYRSVLDLSGEADGAHKLSVVVSSTKDGLLKTVEYNLVKSGNTVTVSDGEVTGPAQPDLPPAETAKNAEPSLWKVFVDGDPVTVEAYNIEGANYLKLRDMALSLSGTDKQFEVGYDAEARIVTIESGKPYTPNNTEGGTATAAKMTEGKGNPILKDSQNVEVDSYLIDGSNYYGLRAMMRLLDVGLDFDGDAREIYIDTTQSYSD